MNDEQLLRYSRHILLPQVDIEGQERLLAARVLIVGAGGLGSPAALYLASAGVGTLVLADGDTVDLTNLQRQILHRQSGIGSPKARSGQKALAEINPGCRVIAIEAKLQGMALDQEVAAADVVLDCTDNFVTRHAINRACVKHQKPLVSGAAIGFDGQVSVYDTRQESSPCYHCLYPQDLSFQEEACATMGVFAPITGIIGAMQAAEAMKLLIGCGDPLVGRLLMLDGLSMAWESIGIERNEACGVCGSPGKSTGKGTVGPAP